MACRGMRPASSVLVAAAALLLVLWSPAARAQLGAAPSDIVLNATTGRVLSAEHPDELRFPASLTKLMTLYLTFEALRDRRITLYQLVSVSAHAASMEPVKLWLVPGTRITVEQCILAMVTLSANDAAAAIGELLGGTERRFAEMMTLRARALGMSRTVFRNASGLPDPAQVTTARDVATLVRNLQQDFPQDYHYFSVSGFVFHGRRIYGHDPMLGAYPGVDGLKTGYTSAAGFNMATSSVQDGTRLIGIVLGAPSSVTRTADMVSLLDEGFAQSGITIAEAGARQSVHTVAFISSASAAERPLSTRGLMEARPSLSGHRPSPSMGYVVQVGSFSTWKAALTAVRRTVATVGGVAHVHRVTVHGRPIWQGRVVSLTRVDPCVSALNECAERGAASFCRPEACDESRVAEYRSAAH
jgi:D-alanyl-D-alanine carboxypeptidase